MQFDLGTLFWYTGTSYAFTSGNFATVVGVTESGSGSSVINLVNARDLGVGDGVAIPKLAIIVGTGITTANTTATIQFRFQGSTDSTNWTNYAMSEWLTTASLTATSRPLMIDVPRVPTGVSLPTYYRLFMDVDNTAGTQTISAGTLLAGIVLSRDDHVGGGQYASGFTVV